MGEVSTNRPLTPGDKVTISSINLINPPTAGVIEMGATTHVLPCSKCGREQVMPVRTVMFFCHACSATMGQKK